MRIFDEMDYLNKEDILSDIDSTIAAYCDGNHSQDLMDRLINGLIHYISLETGISLTASSMIVGIFEASLYGQFHIELIKQQVQSLIAIIRISQNDGRGCCHN